MEAFCLEPTSDTLNSLHPKLKEGFETIFSPAISMNRQGIVENGKLKRVTVDSLSQRPIVIQTINDHLNFAFNAVIATKHPTLGQLIQALPVHARLVNSVHDYAGTTHPATVGLITPAWHPSPENTPTIVATSVCWSDSGPDMEIRRIAQNNIRKELERILGKHLPQSAGHCVEDHAFICLEQAMKNQLPMFSLVLGIKHLLPDSDGFLALLAATGDEIEDVVRTNTHRMFAMCSVCQQIRDQINPNLLDLAAYFRKNCKKHGVV